MQLADEDQSDSVQRDRRLRDRRERADAGRTTGRAKSCTMNHDTCRATQRCSQDQRLLLSHRAVGPADVQRWIHTYGDRGPAPLEPAARSNDHDRWAARDRTRSAEVCYAAGLDNAGCATRLRRQAKEERRGPDPSWNRLKADYCSPTRDGQGL
jgi:hypothetical protein